MIPKLTYIKPMLVAKRLARKPNAATNVPRIVTNRQPYLLTSILAIRPGNVLHRDLVIIVHSELEI